ncbi:zinc-dependent peptidase [Zooshikella marina]|uniref:M90 family metallopeptidase n=1 Tax=Zooshikella ganghwensis TaxID=202772 RepID=UPI0006847C67|nr:M90 family metallopeptidase [Zooshikella ganghwensis]MBU2707185.1 zinc-dependent peptidase [Zooshikella ganghwensis]
MPDVTLIIYAIVCIILLSFVVFKVFIAPQLRRKRVLKTAFPQSWHQILNKNFAIYNLLPHSLKIRLQKLIQLFLLEKKFYGCQGLTLTEEIRVTIAAQACLLILNQPRAWYSKLQSILVYPGAFTVPNAQYSNEGIISNAPSHRLGESWHNGRIILSWDDVINDSRCPQRGQNVTFHEFAHQLDAEDGYTDGIPILGPKHSFQHWSHLMAEELARLRHEVIVGIPHVINQYGATNPAEFFAVATETFFTHPHQLATHNPALFQVLQSYYQLDPRSWTKNHLPNEN